jgi:LuxR family maltose regulon positive regulatory protein
LLAILPGRAKNIEIADLLGVSVNTVKTRLRRLYAKLGAANRDEAIERARERGLLVEFES